MLALPKLLQVTSVTHAIKLMTKIHLHHFRSTTAEQTSTLLAQQVITAARPKARLRVLKAFLRQTLKSQSSRHLQQIALQTKLRHQAMKPLL
jgi:hypothetical protein